MIEYSEIDGERHRYRVVHGRDSITVWFDGRTYHVPRTNHSNSAHHGTASGSDEVTALMPGKLLRLEVAVGDTVAQKQPVAIMESMKMETTLYATKAGRISEIRCRPGESLEMGQIVLTIE